MFICGNDDDAKKTVAGILEQFGWEVADMGKAEAARAIEPLCMLWCIPGFLRNDWVARLQAAGVGWQHGGDAGYENCFTACFSKVLLSRSNIPGRCGPDVRAQRASF